MIRFLKSLSFLLIAFFSLPLPVRAASNSQSTGYTYIKTISGEVSVSQDAYLPSAVYLDLDLQEPQDLFVHNDTMYIADKGSSRVLVIDLKTSNVKVIGQGILSEPTGVSADSDGKIYVADNKNKEAYRFDKNGNLEFTFKKPDNPAFGRNQGFNPKKVAATGDGGIYLVSEGTTAGIIHLGNTGEFLGYFASNEVSLSFFDRLRDIILTEKQKSYFLKRNPPSFGNIFRGPDGLVYTINRGAEVYVKKHSISGLDLLKNAQSRVKLHDPADLCVAPDGRIYIYILQGNGVITEMSNEGYLICNFAGNSDKQDLIGLFELPVGIGVDSENNVYVLDGQRAFIQVFSPTPMQTNIHRALQAYNDGQYDESIKLFSEVLKFNDSSFLAHLYMGNNYLQQSKYENALYEFSVARTKPQYSTAYWEIRNIWLQQNLGSIMLIILGVWIFFTAARFIWRKRGGFESLKKLSSYVCKNRFIRDILTLKYAMLHPIDNAYNVKTGATGTYASAISIYVIIFIELVLYQVGRGFVYSVNISDYSISNVLVYYTTTVILFTACNYFISAVNDGNGTFRAIFIGTAYCFAPIILFMPFIIFLSNFATLNEEFLISASSLTLLVWCIINVFLMIIEIHEYSFKMALFNIAMTLFSMGVTVLAGSMVYLLVNQVYAFVQGLVTEVVLRAKAA